ncbi:MAG: hypothetical protein HFJ41_08435 [Clostridia bacterium]|nr:hypothetical protein [Clostridia bacterium]
MEDLLVQLVETFGYPIIKQGTLGADEEYPESFFTFWNNSADGNQFYDNKENSIIWDFDLNFYSSNPELVSKELMRAKELLNQHGFIINGKGHDVKSDEITHTGRGIDVKIIENI